MPRFAALLRGVNVGGGNRVPMAELRALLEDLGYTEVATLLNSGNAVFTSGGRSSARHEPQIRAALKASLGVDVAVIVKSGADLLAAQKENPIRVQEAEGSRLLVGFRLRPREPCGAQGRVVSREASRAFPRRPARPLPLVPEWQACRARRASSARPPRARDHHAQLGHTPQAHRTRGTSLTCIREPRVVCIHEERES
jgi:hypothetical protein